MINENASDNSGSYTDFQYSIMIVLFYSSLEINNCPDA